MTDWLTVTEGTAPLLVSIPHCGIDLAGLDNRLVSPWLGRRDCDWWIDNLYDFAAGLGATVVHTSISRTVIDVNRDPSGASLYPGQATTTLCPTTTFDGDPLYLPGEEPMPAEIDQRRVAYFVPYHEMLAAQAVRLRGLHEKIVIYDCHSIRSELPLLFYGTLPVFNLGTNDGQTCDPALQALVGQIMVESGESNVINGRFKGGWITRYFGNPQGGYHALQMELADRGYLREPQAKGEPDNWPVPYDAEFAAPMRATLTKILQSAIDWAGR